MTHLCGAPIVLTMLIHAPDEREAPLRPHGRGRHRRRRAAVGGDRGDGGDGLPRHAPLRPHRDLRARDALRVAGRVGRRCRSTSARAQMARQGVRYADARRAAWSPIPRRWQPVPRDGATHGRGDAARQHDHEGLPQEPDGDRRRRSRGGWFHTGDLARLASGRLHRDQGPQQGHHHLRRREHLARSRSRSASTATRR